MTEVTVRHLALILAASARVEGMKASNQQRSVLGESAGYTEQDFGYEAAELGRLAYSVVQQ